MTRGKFPGWLEFPEGMYPALEALMPVFTTKPLLPEAAELFTRLPNTPEWQLRWRTAMEKFEAAAEEVGAVWRQLP